MATEAQIAANKANAQKSTGPRTEEGKAKACMNRLTHGFASAKFILPTEDPEKFMHLMSDLEQEHLPATPTEQILVEKMAQTQWLTQRALNLQGEAFLEMAAKAETGIPKSLSLLMRYYTSADRAFHKAHNELLKVQKQRANDEIGFEPQKPAEPHSQTPPQPLKPEEMTRETITQEFIENETDYDLIEKILMTPKKAA